MTCNSYKATLEISHAVRDSNFTVKKSVDIPACFADTSFCIAHAIGHLSFFQVIYAWCT